MADRKWPLGNFFGKNLVWNSRRTAQKFGKDSGKSTFRFANGFGSWPYILRPIDLQLNIRPVNFLAE